MHYPNIGDYVSIIQWLNAPLIKIDLYDALFPSYWSYSWRKNGGARNNENYIIFFENFMVGDEVLKYEEKEKGI